ncbi:MAG: hypothetical protein WBV94_00435 [Blastocatellia bacterium]
MWQTIRNTLLRWLLGILDPNFNAELDAFEKIEAAKQRELEALQGEIAKLDQQITAAQRRQIEAQSEVELHLAEVTNIEVLIEKVRNERPSEITINDDDALRNQL